MAMTILIGATTQRFMTRFILWLSLY